MDVVTVFDTTEEVTVGKPEKQLFYENLAKNSSINAYHYKMFYDMDNDLEDSEFVNSDIPAIVAKQLLNWCVPIILPKEQVSEQSLMNKSTKPTEAVFSKVEKTKIQAELEAHFAEEKKTKYKGRGEEGIEEGGEEDDKEEVGVEDDEEEDLSDDSCDTFDQSADEEDDRDEQSKDTDSENTDIQETFHGGKKEQKSSVSTDILHSIMIQSDFPIPAYVLPNELNDLKLICLAQNESFRLVGFIFPTNFLAYRYQKSLTFPHLIHTDFKQLILNGGYGVQDFHTKIFTQSLPHLTKYGRKPVRHAQHTAERGHPTLNSYYHLYFMSAADAMKKIINLKQYIIEVDDFYRQSSLYIDDIRYYQENVVEYKIPADHKSIRLKPFIKTNNVLEMLSTISNYKLNYSFTYNVVNTLVKTNLLEAYNVASILGTSNELLKKYIESYKITSQITESKLQQRMKSEELSLINSHKRVIALKKYGLALENLSNSQLKNINSEYEKNRVYSQAKASKQQREIQSLIKQLESDVLSTDKKQLIYTLKSLHSLIGKKVSYQSLLSSGDCPHIIVKAEKTLEHFGKPWLNTQLRQYLMDNFALPLESSGYYCKLCGSLLYESDEENITFKSMYGITDDPLKNMIWKEVAYNLMTYVKYMEPIPLKPLITTITNSLRDIIGAEETKLMRSRTNVQDSVKDTIFLYISIYIYAIIVTLILKNPTKLTFARNIQMSREPRKDDLQKPQSRDTEEVKIPVESNPPSVVNVQQPGGLIVSKQLGETSSLSQKPVEKTKKEKSVKQGKLAKPMKIKKPSKKTGASELTADVIIGAEEVGSRQMEQALLNTALYLIFTTKNIIITKLKNINKEIIKQIFLKKAYLWARSKMTGIPLYDEAKRESHKLLTSVITDSVYRYMWYGLSMAEKNPIKIHDVTKILGRPIEKIDTGLKDAISMYETFDIPAKWPSYDLYSDVPINMYDTHIKQVIKDLEIQQKIQVMMENELIINKEEPQSKETKESIENKETKETKENKEQSPDSTTKEVSEKANVNRESKKSIKKNLVKNLKKTVVKNLKTKKSTKTGASDMKLDFNGKISDVMNMIANYYKFQSFNSVMLYTKKEIGYQTALPMSPSLVKFLKHFAPLGDLQKVLHIPYHYRVAKYYNRIHLYHDYTWDLNKFDINGLNRAVYYCPTGKKHNFSIIKYDLAGSGRAKKSVEYTNKDIDTMIKTDPPSYMKLVGATIVDYKCSNCNKYLSAVNKMDVDAELNRIQLLDTFYKYYESRCPVKDLHEFTGDKCSKCGFITSYSSSYDMNYYKKYSHVFDKIQKIKHDIFVQQVGQIQGAYKQDIKSFISYTKELDKHTKEKDPTKFSIDLYEGKKYPDYSVTFRELIELAQITQIKYNVLLNIGLTDGILFKSIELGKANPSAEESATSLTRSMKIKNHIFKIIRDYNTIRNFEDLYDLSPKIKLIVDKQRKIGLKDIKGKLPDIVMDFIPRDQYYSTHLPVKYYNNFLLNHLASMLVTIVKQTKEPFKEMSKDIVNYFIGDIIHSEKTFSKTLPIVIKKELSKEDEASESEVSGDAYQDNESVSDGAASNRSSSSESEEDIPDFFNKEAQLDTEKVGDVDSDDGDDDDKWVRDNDNEQGGD